MDSIIIGGIAYAAVALLAARGGGFLRSCDDAMRDMMTRNFSPNGADRTHQQSMAKEVCS